MKALWKTKSRAELMADKVADYGREPNKYNYRIKNSYLIIVIFFTLTQFFVRIKFTPKNADFSC